MFIRAGEPIMFTLQKTQLGNGRGRRRTQRYRLLRNDQFEQSFADFSSAQRWLREWQQ
jgi:hypothetical protein